MMKDLIASIGGIDILLLIILLAKIIYDLVIYFLLRSGIYAKSGKSLLSKYNFGFFFGIGIYTVLCELTEINEVGITSTLIIGILYILLFTYRFNKYEILFKKGYFIYRDFGYPYVFKYKDVRKLNVDHDIIDIYIKDRYFTSTLKLPEQEKTIDFLVKKMGNKVNVY